MKIEDILMRNEQLVLENEALHQQIEDLKNGFEGCCPVCEPVGEMNKKLREERDEARRVVCCTALPSNYKEWKPTDVGATLKLIAAQQGWDCFREES
jgi:hypothetical protein